MTIVPQNDIVAVILSRHLCLTLSTSLPLLRKMSMSLFLLCILNGLIRESISLAVSFACYELIGNTAAVDLIHRFIGLVVVWLEVVAFDSEATLHLTNDKLGIAPNIQRAAAHALTNHVVQTIN